MALVYDDFYKTQVNNLAGQKNQSLADLNKLYDSQRSNLNAQYDAALNKAGAAYEDQYRNNAVQKLINERAVAENMANLGLTDSGLNRTQQTAVQLSYANNKGNIDRQRQQQLDAINLEKTSGLSGIEQQRLAGQDEINKYYTSLAAQNATDAYSEYVKAEQQKYQAQLEAQLESQRLAIEAAEKSRKSVSDNKGKEYNYLMSALRDKDGIVMNDLQLAAKLIDEYAYTYDISQNELHSLLRTAGLSQSDFDRYVSTGSVYVAPSNYSEGAKVKKWNYKKDGNVNYKFEVVKDTINWFGGSDNNDIITIRYPDGTLLAENVRVDKLPKSIRAEVSKKIKKAGKNGSFNYKTNLKDSKF